VVVIGSLVTISSLPHPLSDVKIKNEVIKSSKAEVNFFIFSPDEKSFVIKIGCL
jgi:flavoprotein